VGADSATSQSMASRYRLKRRGKNCFSRRTFKKNPDIPPVATVSADQCFRVECVDWTGGQIGNNDSAKDVADVDLSQVHYLSGPFKLVDENGPAMPGDLLAVELCDLGPLAESLWGFTGSFSRENGGGLLCDHFEHATKAIWDFEGIYATSRHIHGVRFAGLIHPGLIGTAPSAELLKLWNEREADLVSRGESSSSVASVLHTRPLAQLPQEKGALLGKIERYRCNLYFHCFF
jgi:formamidase